MDILELKEQLYRTLNLIQQYEIDKAKQDLEKDLKIMKLERGNESLVDVIKVKEGIINDLREDINFYRPKGKVEVQK